MAVSEQAAPIIVAVTGFLSIFVSAYVALKQGKSPDAKKSDNKAIAVTNLEQTTTRVDNLWETIKDLIEEVGKLKEDKAMQQEQISELTRQLAEEKENHARTRQELEELKKEHAKTLIQLAEKNALIEKLMKEQTHGSKANRTRNRQEPRKDKPSDYQKD